MDPISAATGDVFLVGTGGRTVALSDGSGGSCGDRCLIFGTDWFFGGLGGSAREGDRAVAGGGGG
jgi:hypothetical protein